MFHSTGISLPHPELQALRTRLQQILHDMSTFGPIIPKPPILDLSYDVNKAGGASGNSGSASHESVPGLRALRDAVRRDLDVLDKFLADPKCASYPPLSTNAPYLIAVWNEVLLARPPIVAIWCTYSENNQESTSSRRGSQKPPGVKVDAVVEDGRRWIRVNTTKNSRMLAEFRELDSYLTDSDNSDSEEPSSSLAPSQFDNSLLKMGRALITAALQNPLPSHYASTTEDSSVVPAVTLRLTRLDLFPTDPSQRDHRIAKTIEELRAMGIDVQLGERDAEVSALPPRNTSPKPKTIPRMEPTTRINLDLSSLIALVSDITHAPLPRDAADAEKRYEPPAAYREWKKKKLEALRGEQDRDAMGTEYEYGGEGLRKHSRALANQAMQEMQRGLLQEMHDRLLALSLSPSPDEFAEGTNTFRCFPHVEFWTTSEARDRFLRIVLSKIGGTNEKRRAHALLSSDVSSSLSIEEAEEAYWRNSRYPRGFLPLLPIYIFPEPQPAAGLEPPSETDEYRLSLFFLQLAQTCRNVLAQETTPHPQSSTLITPTHVGSTNPGDVDYRQAREEEVVPRVTVTRANPRLTAHTVRTLLWGAANGWTTLTANKASVKAILREISAARNLGGYGSDGLLSERVRALSDVEGQAETGSEDRSTGKAAVKVALWVVDPRSLAEGMRSDLEQAEDGAS